MTTSYTLDLDTSPSDDDVRVIRSGLDHYNAEQVGPTQWQPLAVFVRDDDHQIVGGLTGGTYWGYLYIDVFWLSDALRGQGYGTQMLQMAEQAAIARGCTYAHLDTMSFQALPFYEKQGYSVWGG